MIIQKKLDLQSWTDLSSPDIEISSNFITENVRVFMKLTNEVNKKLNV